MIIYMFRYNVLFVTLHGHFREITVRTLGEYTDLRRQLTSKTIYILVSACSNKVEEKTNREVPGMYDLLILLLFYKVEVFDLLL